ncbi:MAG: LolA family protein [Phycisphaerales bacterium]
MMNGLLISVFVAGTVLGGQPEKVAPPVTTPAPAQPPAAPAATAPATPEDGKPALKMEVQTQAVDPKVDDLLTRLETADKELKSLTANIKFFKVFPAGPLGGGMHQRDGTLKFGRRVDGAGVKRRMFVVQFDSLVMDSKLRKETKQYVFDGEVLIERTPDEKNFHRQRLVAPGADVDPLRLGQGRVQFPMPLGQKKADMVAVFTITTPPALENVPNTPSMQQMLADAIQVRLVPIKNTVQARDFVEIRIWYRPSDLLPLFAQAVNTDGSKAEVLLEDLKPNVEIPAAAFDTKAPDPKEGWQGTNKDAIEGKR